jgi:hypothetical protein
MRREDDALLVDNPMLVIAAPGVNRHDGQRNATTVGNRYCGSVDLRECFCWSALA